MTEKQNINYKRKKDKTPVFYVNDMNGYEMLCKYKDEVISWNEAIDRGITNSNLVEFELTKQEIKSYDPKIWEFNDSILEQRGARR